MTKTFAFLLAQIFSFALFADNSSLPKIAQDAAAQWNSARAEKTIVVAKDGSDTDGDGSADKPYASPARAIKDLSKEKNSILIKSGVYMFDKTAEISNAKFSPDNRLMIVGESGNGKKVEFIGAKRIDARKLKKVSDAKILARLRKPSNGTLYSLDLKEFGLDNYGKMAQRGFMSPVYPMQMEAFFSGSRDMRLARWPNGGVFPVGKVVDVGYIKSEAKIKNTDKTKRGAKFIAAHEIPEYWTKHDDVWLAGVFYLGWADDHQRVKSVDMKTGQIELQYPSAYGVSSSQKGFITNTQDISARGYFVYNLLEEIDEPFEYYIDRKNGVFYVMLPQEPEDGQYFDFTTLETPILKITDSDNVALFNIGFGSTRGTALSMSGCNNVVVSGCEFKNCGTEGAGAFPSKTQTSPKNNYVFFKCAFKDNGAGGLSLFGGERKTLETSNNLVAYCLFDANCRIKKNYSPGLKIGGVGTRVSNCEFSNAEHQLLSFMGNDHIIENNIFKDACHNSSDMGCIYTGRNPSNKGVAIRNNFFTNVRSYNPDGKVCAVYIDDGSGGMEISSNIFCKSGTPGNADVFGAVFFHGGHDNIVKGNVFIECDASVAHSRWDDKRWKNTFFKEYLYRLKKEVDIESEPYKKYPQLKDFFTTDRERFNTVANNLFYKTPPPYWGDFKLSNRKCKLEPSSPPKVEGEWTLEDVEKYFGNNKTVRKILESKIGRK